MTVIGLIRHGETMWNQQNRMQGQTDIPLNDTGRHQAEQLARRLQYEQWDAMISSDLQRAAETAAIISRLAGIQLLRYEPRLRERFFGRMEGTTLEERLRLWGENWRLADHAAEDEDRLLNRGLGVIGEVADKLRGKRVLLVTHGGLIRQILKATVPDLEIRQIANTSLSLLKVDNGGWSCELFNCTRHLS
ncbi:histidine phosphatase family protein [Ferviditalea candida]|uniref:Histidine phosphatase family protein n=1 Tax=Ferviditalea candida TaxID=3108399 RepID=A0ABU5ZFJ8_9BACL|nr:histidine phosphatase family protein [Paenibacillaceae bacterium T2]